MRRLNALDALLKLVEVIAHLVAERVLLRLQAPEKLGQKVQHARLARFFGAVCRAEPLLQVAHLVLQRVLPAFFVRSRLPLAGNGVGPLPVCGEGLVRGALLDGPVA